MKIAVIIPSYKVKKHVLDVLSKVGPDVWRIYVVDDCCPEGSGRFVEERANDPRVTVVYNQENLGVGGAVMVGFKKAIEDGADILVKIDGDGQMNPALLPYFTAPIAHDQADYTKGNRFYDLTNVGRMPAARLFGNAVLSFLTKFSSGYWNIFDPTNGYLAISAKVAQVLPFDKIHKRYFFETDMLFRLNIVRAKVLDIPMDAVYKDEVSNLKISKELRHFFFGHLKNTGKRIFYNYFLRDMSIGSLELVLGILMTGFGIIFGLTKWVDGLISEMVTGSGTVMLAALPFILGMQFLLAFLGGDIANTPKSPISALLSGKNSL